MAGALKKNSGFAETTDVVISKPLVANKWLTLAMTDPVNDRGWGGGQQLREYHELMPQQNKKYQVSDPDPENVFAILFSKVFMTITQEGPRTKACCWCI